MTISRTNEDFLKTYPKGSVHTKLKINHLVAKPNFGPLQNFLKTISKLLSDRIKITTRTPNVPKRRIMTELERI